MDPLGGVVRVPLVVERARADLARKPSCECDAAIPLATEIHAISVIRPLLPRLTFIASIITPLCLER